MYWPVGARHWAWDNNARFGVVVGEVFWSGGRGVFGQQRDVVALCQPYTQYLDDWGDLL